MLLLLILPSLSNAALKTCGEVISECREVVDKADTVIAIQEEDSRLLKEQNERLEKALSEETARAAHDEAWYRDPKFVVPATFILGFVTAVFAERH